METYVPNKEQIFEMIETANSLKNRAILAMLACTGMTSGSIVALKHEDVLDLDHWSNPRAITENRGKKYYTFLSEKATLHLKRYMKLKQYKYGIIILEDPVFNSEFQGIKKDKRPNKQMVYENIEHIVRETAEIANIPNKDRINPKSFREYYKAVLTWQNKDGSFLGKEMQQFLTGTLIGDPHKFFEKEMISELRTAYAKFNFF